MTSNETEVTTGTTDPSDQPLTTLRGARVDVDGRRVGRVVGGALLVTLAVLTVVLFVVGAQKNSQIERLRQNGVAVKVTVSGCRALMGGSGSNLVGYACQGTFSLGGHHYSEAIPGTTLYAPGTSLRAVSVPGDPGLLSTASSVAADHPSWRVFIVPTCLLVVLAVLVGALVLRRRRTPRTAPQSPSVGPS